MNADGRMNAKYSSPMEYTAAKRAEKTVVWPVKRAAGGDDFFPYAGSKPDE